MANERCLDQQSAISEQTKKAILSQEVVRRMMNMCEHEKQGVRDEILDKFDRRMTISGYDMPDRKEVMRRGLISYEKIREASQRGERSIHRRGRSTVSKR